jgi:RIO kinase 1
MDACASSRARFNSITGKEAHQCQPFLFIDSQITSDQRNASQHRRSELKNYYPESNLDSFLNDGHLSEVLHVIEGGKEGIVYCCRGGPLASADLVAAKVYHPLHRRAFRRDAGYQDSRLRGPKVRREKLAMAKGSAFGRRVQYGTWLSAEFETLDLLHRAGADVPFPIALGEGAVLMQYIGDETAAAPRLAQVELARDEAMALFERVLRNVGLWLDLDRIHGDLSPYNILYFSGAITVIDFPQAIDARFNPNARDLLQRDLANVCGYFQRYGIRCDPERIAARMWGAYRHGAALT